MSRSWFRENGPTSFHLPPGFWQFLGFVSLLMARRKALKRQKWETNHADATMLAAPRPALRFHFCDGSLLQRPASENEHRKQDIPPAAFLCITCIFNHKTEPIATMSTHLQSSLLAFPFAQTLRNDLLVKLCFGISNQTSSKKKNIYLKVQILATFFKWSAFKVDQNQKVFRACSVLIALQSVAGTSHFNIQQ